MSIGERITELRKERNISQGELAKLMDVSRQAVSKWENDQSYPDTLKMIHLADVLNTEVEYLATGVKPQNLSPIVVNVVKNPEKVVERIVEKPVVKHVVRVRYRNNLFVISLVAIFSFGLGILIGAFFF